MTMVRLEKVNKSYGNVVALHQVDLSVEEGEFVTLLGPSGCGKTTMLNLIAGMIAPSSGRIHIAGKDATDIPANKRGLGMVFQNYALMPHMTIFENIAFPLRVRRMRSAEIKKKVSEVLDLVKLPHIANRKPQELSGGQQQRVSIARCIVYNPSIILMDEPMGALDKKLREQMQLELKRIHTELKITMLYVTHDQEEALTMSDRIILLNDGEVEQMGSPEELYFQPCSSFAANFLGDSNLMEATVKEMGKTLKVALCSGDEIWTRPAAFAAPGQKVKAMVRPENVNILRPEQQANGFDNRIKGTAIDSIILGGVIKHYVRLEGNATVVAQELTRTGRRALTPGEPVELAWRQDDTLVLPLVGKVVA
ncbi:ABC transporter ATP-binding protein [Bradyrhizobium sp. Tv2a-2]|uniref:ABC transporter ATP-binding protein n=1 Tax=Bradyrhizobium sp. Tv2a-2 TaxID=113395 RepID=UPI0003FC8474|nr:ABC transporter ATP-binding protein [Bradyrhizobium sp. Tv2a-2]